MQPSVGTEVRPAPLDDAEVVRRVLAGEPALFEVLMRRHDQRLFRTVRAVLRDDDAAEDALQQAWIRLYTRLGQYEGTSTFATWATRIALNEALQRRRSDARRERLAGDGAPSPSPVSRPDERAASRELARALERAIDTLPVGQRAALLLRDVEGLSTAETAASLGTSEALVKKRLERARRSLREWLLGEMGLAAPEVFGFRGERCARMVRAVMAHVLDT